MSESGRDPHQQAPAGPYPPGAGLTHDEAARRLERDGRNVVPGFPGYSWPRALARQFTHLMAVLLWVASVMALVAGTPALSVAIVIVIVFNAVFSFWQEYRADRSMDRLLALMPAKARVVRDGVAQSIDPAELVRGDRISVRPGDRVPADVLVGEAENVRVDESMMTGESAAITKRPGDELLAGTHVVQGMADGTVVRTGSGTGLAKIAALARSARRPPSPLTTELNRVVRTIAAIAVSTGVLLGVGGVRVGLTAAEAFLFGVGVAVALVPEGLLPTVTLSLAHGARLMARQNALVRRLDAVETLGATTMICTDKTGTLTQNRMEVVEAWTPVGSLTVHGSGYSPSAEIGGRQQARQHGQLLARAAALCVTGRPVRRGDDWTVDGDPLEVAIWVFALRNGLAAAELAPDSRSPYTVEQMTSSAVRGGMTAVIGAPERVIARCAEVSPEVGPAMTRLTERGLRVIAVAQQNSGGVGPDAGSEDLQLLGLLGMEDPPRPDVHHALAACRAAGITVIMITGDHLGTATAIAHETGLLGETGTRLTSPLLVDDDTLGELLDNPAGAVVARVTPAEKVRIARVMRDRGHVVAMTGDGVNDAPALREADVGVAMGASGTDVAREAADLVLLDDHFATIVAAVRLGRTTFANARRFLTFHLSDNVAELAPFVVWAFTGGEFPLAISVLQVLALDIGTDMLPALALGLEPPSKRVLLRHPGKFRLIDRTVTGRAFGLLGPVEAVLSVGGFWIVLVSGGWAWGAEASGGLLASASGTAFAVIVTSQIANAFACRSETVPALTSSPLGNRALLIAVAIQAALLVMFLGVEPLSTLLGGTWPPPVGWAFVAAAPLAVLLADALQKTARRRLLGSI